MGPANQRPELWSLYNGRHHKGEHIRVFPLSNWTELDIWQYIDDEEIELPALYYAHQREVVRARRHAARGQPVRRAASRRGAVRGDRSASARSATPPAPAASSPPPRPRRASSPRSPRRGSPSAAPPGPTTGSPKPAWKTARRRATSDVGSFCGSRPPGRSTTASPRSSAGCSTTRKAIFEDQLEAVERTSRDAGDDVPDLALLTDGLRAEREQGITIDVAYRYFATPQAQVHHRRHPRPHSVHAQHGHRRVDRRPRADPDRRPQRRARAVAPARVPRVAARHPAPRALRQQDGPRRLRPRTASRRSARSSAAFAIKLEVTDLTFIPISALARRQRRHPQSANMPWYEGPSLLHHLEEVHVASDRNLIDARFPVQYVIRPQQPTTRTTTAATPAPLPAACSAPATKSWCCRRASPRRSSRCDGPAARAGRGVRRPGGHHRARRRHRHQPRRHDLPPLSPALSSKMPVSQMPILTSSPAFGATAWMASNSGSAALNASTVVF